MPITPELKALLGKTKQYEDPTLELIGTLVEYVVTLHDRIEALEKGPQNQPFVMPQKIKPSDNDFFAGGGDTPYHGD